MKSDLMFSIKEELATELDKEKELLNKALEANKEELNLALEKNEKSLNAQIKITKGGAFLIQANNQLDKNNIDDAIDSSVNAIECFITAKDETNLQRVLNNTITILLPKASKNLANVFPDVEDRINKICERLKALNDNGRYIDNINDIKRGLKNALEREINQ